MPRQRLVFPEDMHALIDDIIKVGSRLGSSEDRVEFDWWFCAVGIDPELIADWLRFASQYRVSVQAKRRRIRQRAKYRLTMHGPVSGISDWLAMGHQLFQINEYL